MLEVPQGWGLKRIEECKSHLAPHHPYVGVVGHTTDRCIMPATICRYAFSYNMSRKNPKSTDFTGELKIDHFLDHNNGCREVYLMSITGNSHQLGKLLLKFLKVLIINFEQQYGKIKQSSQLSH